MQRKLGYLIGLSLLWLLVGCKRPNPKVPEDLHAQFSYFKDCHGICYAAVASFNGIGGSTISIATVPCEKVGL